MWYLVSLLILPELIFGQTWSWAERDVRSRSLVSLELKEEIITSSREIRFGDLVQLPELASNLEFWQEQKDLIIGPSPDPGEKVVIKAPDLIKQLQEMWPDIKIKLKGSIVVQTLGQKVQLSALHSAIGKQLERLNSCSASVKVKLKALNLTKPWLVPLGDYKINIPAWENKECGQYKLDLEKYRGELLKVMFVHRKIKRKGFIRLQIQQQALRAKRKLNPRANLAASDFEKFWYESFRLHDFFTELDALNKHQLSSTLLKGQVLRDSSLRPKLMVRRGEMLTLRVGKRNFEVSVPVKALANGKTGEVIPVRYQKGKKSLQARIMGPKMVVVEL